MAPFTIGQASRVHFIGAGGINMSGLAELLHLEGYGVSGSDARDGDAVARLRGLGVDIRVGHSAANIPEDADTVVYTAAVKPDNPELMAARARGLRVLERSELLGLAMRNYDHPVCVAGTHGKTTVTSMITEICVAAGLDPTMSGGGVLPSIGAAFRHGGRHTLVAEACEYCDSFLRFYPYIGVILNVELDHTDYFQDLAHIRRSFRAFAERIPKEGALILHAGIENREELTDGLPCRIITYGADNADWIIQNLTYDEEGCASFQAIPPGTEKGSGDWSPAGFGAAPQGLAVHLLCPGEHNAHNALAAIAAASLLGAGADACAKALGAFTGAERRFQKLGVTEGGVTVVDDYAHHPTEIRATLAAAKTGGKLWVAFQPHTKERTREQMIPLSESFDAADEVVALEIFAPAGREHERMDVGSAELAERIARRGKPARYCATFEEARAYLAARCRPGDLLIVMGAGDVYRLGYMMLANHAGQPD